MREGSLCDNCGNIGHTMLRCPNAPPANPQPHRASITNSDPSIPAKEEPWKIIVFPKRNAKTKGKPIQESTAGKGGVQPLTQVKAFDTATDKFLASNASPTPENQKEKRKVRSVNTTLPPLTNKVNVLPNTPPPPPPGKA
ncbi:hypothetical protein FXO37_23923 [Capsicum annuum]|nr:hypothetical protein FXO37_23923 [Capsicum annuum]